MKKVNISAIALAAVAFACCTHNPTQKDWKGALACPELDLTAKLEIADSVLSAASDSEYDDILDTMASSLLTVQLLDQEMQETQNIILDKADDNRAILLTVRGQGTMCTGTTYILYRKNDGSATIKKVAYEQQSIEGGGPSSPAQYQEIVKTDSGYQCRGRSAFSTTSDVYVNKMDISAEYLENGGYLYMPPNSLCVPGGSTLIGQWKPEGSAYVYILYHYGETPYLAKLQGYDVVYNEEMREIGSSKEHRLFIPLDFPFGKAAGNCFEYLNGSLKEWATNGDWMLPDTTLSLNMLRERE